MPTIADERAPRKRPRGLPLLAAAAAAVLAATSLPARSEDLARRGPESRTAAETCPSGRFEKDASCTYWADEGLLLGTCLSRAPGGFCTSTLLTEAGSVRLAAPPTAVAFRQTGSG